MVVIDPGPAIPEHVEAIIAAAGDRPDRWRSPVLIPIATTAPRRALLKDATGAPIIGCAALSLESVGPRADASFDGDYAPDQVLADGETITFGDGEQLRRGRHPGPHVEPSLFRLSRTACSPATM